MSYIAAGNTTTTALTTYGDTTGNLVFTTGGANTTALTLSNTQAATFANNVTITGGLSQTGNASFSNVSVSGYSLSGSNPAFLAYANDTSFTGTTVPYSIASFNIGNNYNTSTYTFTAPVAGIYIFSWQFFNPPSLAASVDFYKNGSPIGRYGTESTAITNYSGWSGSIIVSLAVGDTAKMVRFAGTVHTNPNLSYFSGRLLG